MVTVDSSLVDFAEKEKANIYKVFNKNRKGHNLKLNFLLQKCQRLKRIQIHRTEFAQCKNKLNCDNCNNKKKQLSELSENRFCWHQTKKIESERWHFAVSVVNRCEHTYPNRDVSKHERKQIEKRKWNQPTTERAVCARISKEYHMWVFGQNWDTNTSATHWQLDACGGVLV